MAYQANIPTGTVPLDQDYLNVQGNFSSLNSQFLVDHVPLTSTSGTPPNGYHTAVHLVPQSPDPTPVQGYGELYTKTVNDGYSTGEQLWYQLRNTTPVTLNYPLTLNLQPLQAANGYTFLPGGILLQWGGGNANTPVTFAKQFASAAYAVTITANGIPGSQLGVQAASLTTSGFTPQSTNNVSIYWMAIGK